MKQSFPRLWSLDGGVAMVVTDLHGDWDAYRRYRDHFISLQAQGRADWLIFTGDLIHRDDPYQPDKSLEIVLDILDLREEYNVIYLCGNHEMPHIYGISLSRGNTVYTPSFEVALNESNQREAVISLLESLPFYVRTKAGVLLTHAGAASLFALPANAERVFQWDHHTLLDWADESIATSGADSLRRGYERLSHSSYADMVRYYLAVSSPDDPRYNHLLRGFIASSHPDFSELLWPALFTRCEYQYGTGDYAIFLDALLQGASHGFTPQNYLVAGHIGVKGGHQVIGNRHLRLASAQHATPRKAGRCLLFDTAQPIPHIDTLLNGLVRVFE